MNNVQRPDTHSRTSGSRRRHPPSHSRSEHTSIFQNCSQTDATGKRAVRISCAFKYAGSRVLTLLHRAIDLIRPGSASRSVSRVLHYCSLGEPYLKDIHGSLKDLKHSSFDKWPEIAIRKFEAMDDAAFGTLGKAVLEHGTAWQIEQWIALAVERQPEQSVATIACLREIVAANSTASPSTSSSTNSGSDRIFDEEPFWYESSPPLPRADMLIKVNTERVVQYLSTLHHE